MKKLQPNLANKRWLTIYVAILIFIVGFIVWGGNTGRFNNPEIVYVGRHAQTGQMVAIKGCRPERVLPDGSCDRSFRWKQFLGID